MAEQINRRIEWYRSPIDRKTLYALNQRSNFLGFLQTLGHLSVLTLTGSFAWYAFYNLELPYLLLALFLHGTGYAFLLNGFHEFCHLSVFRTRFLNRFFLNVFSFLGGYNPVAFWASHSDHHKYTLHTPDDLEVVLPIEINLGTFLKVFLVNPMGLWRRWKGVLRFSFGKIAGTTELALFPESDPDLRRRLFNWARVLLIGHSLILVFSVYFELWMIPVLITFAPFYGGWLLFLCNNAQHVGLTDNVPDFRLNSRTIILNPLFRFLYWHMNYHIEHHMFAAIPCYRLGKTHKLIKADLPYSTVGLRETWTQVARIRKRQKTDPEYQFIAELPSPTPPKEGGMDAD
jgi:fatty acid desaturase